MARITFTQQERREIEDICAACDPEKGLMAYYADRLPADDWEFAKNHVRAKVRHAVELGFMLRAVTKEAEARGPLGREALVNLLDEVKAFLPPWEPNFYDHPEYVRMGQVAERASSDIDALDNARLDLEFEAQIRLGIMPRRYADN